MTMKKYMKPEMQIVVLTHRAALLDGSPQLGGEYSGGTVLAPELENIEFNY